MRLINSERGDRRDDLFKLDLGLIPGDSHTEEWLPMGTCEALLLMTVHFVIARVESSETGAE